MSEYIFVTNIFEYSNIRIYSSHSGVKAYRFKEKDSLDSVWVGDGHCSRPKACTVHTPVLLIILVLLIPVLLIIVLLIILPKLPQVRLLSFQRDRHLSQGVFFT